MRILFGGMIALAAFTAVPAHGLTLSYPDFSSVAGLQLNGNAAVATDGAARDVLRVTPSDYWMAGSVFSTSPITFGADYGFSTRFTFNINQPLAGGADGLVFVIQPNANDVGSNGGGIGYQNIGNSLGIEFDTWANGGADDDNHVGINFNGSVNSTYLANPGFIMEGTGDFTAWVDYDGSTLEVRVAQDGSRPLAALLTANVDLASIIDNPQAFVGFTSGTGSAGANHDIVSWEFRDSYRPISNPVPEPTTWALMLAGFGLVGGAMRRQRASGLRLA